MYTTIQIFKFLRCVGVILLFFLISPLDLIGVCFVEDQRTNTIKTHVQNILDCFVNYSILNSEHI